MFWSCVFVCARGFFFLLLLAAHALPFDASFPFGVVLASFSFFHPHPFPPPLLPFAFTFAACVLHAKMSMIPCTLVIVAVASQFQLLLLLHVFLFVCMFCVFVSLPPLFALLIKLWCVFLVGCNPTTLLFKSDSLFFSFCSNT